MLCLAKSEEATTHTNERPNKTAVRQQTSAAPEERGKKGRVTKKKEERVKDNEQGRGKDDKSRKKDGRLAIKVKEGVI